MTLLYAFCQILHEEVLWLQSWNSDSNTGMIIGLRPPNERRRYFVMPSLIGWVQT